jgi:hypothetical protein
LEKAPIAEDNKIRENFDLEKRVSQTYNSARDFAVGSSGVSKVHQLCVIITEAEEENNNEGSKKVDRQVDKIKEQNKKDKEKVHVSAGEWRMIKVAINHGTEVPEGLRREVLMGYQYALYQHRKKLREKRDTVLQNDNSVSREEYWNDYSEDSEYSRERRGDPKHNREATSRNREERYSRSPTPQLEEEKDDFMQKNARSSVDSSAGVFTNYKAKTRGSARRYAPSRDMKPRNSGEQDQGKRYRHKVDKLQGKAKGEARIQLRR